MGFSVWRNVLRTDLNTHATAGVRKDHVLRIETGNSRCSCERFEGVAERGAFEQVLRNDLAAKNNPPNSGLRFGTELCCSGILPVRRHVWMRPGVLTDPGTQRRKPGNPQGETPLSKIFRNTSLGSGKQSPRLR